MLRPLRARIPPTPGLKRQGEGVVTKLRDNNWEEGLNSWVLQWRNAANLKPSWKGARALNTPTLLFSLLYLLLLPPIFLTQLKDRAPGILVEKVDLVGKNGKYPAHDRFIHHCTIGICPRRGLSTHWTKGNKEKIKYQWYLLRMPTQAPTYGQSGFNLFSFLPLNPPGSQHCSSHSSRACRFHKQFYSISGGY